MTTKNLVLTAITFGLQLVVIGQLFTFGKMVPVFENVLAPESSTPGVPNLHLSLISAIGTLQLVMFFISFAVTAKMIHYKTTHTYLYIFVGGIMWGLGMILSAAVHTLDAVFGFQSVLVGFGGSLVYWSSLAHLTQVAGSAYTQIAVMGGGVGMLIYIATSTFFNSELVITGGDVDGQLQWELAYIIIGALGMSFMIVAASVFYMYTDANDSFQEKNSTALQLSRSSLTTLIMGFIYASILLSNMAIFVPFAHIVQYMKELNLQVESTTPGVMRNLTITEFDTVSSDAFYLLAGGSIAGRIAVLMARVPLTYFFGNNKLQGILVMYVTNLWFVAITLFLWLECKSRDSIFSFAFFFGFGSGGALSIMPVLIRVLVEQDPLITVSDVLSIFNVFMAIGAGVSAVIAGAIHDSTGGFNDAIISTACFQLFAGVAGFGALACTSSLINIKEKVEDSTGSTEESMKQSNNSKQPTKAQFKKWSINNN